MIMSAINDKFDELSSKERYFFESFGRGKFSFLNYHESKLSLIAREAVRLLVNYQVIPFTKWPKSISLEQRCHCISQAIVVPSLHCLYFSTLKNKDPKRISKIAIIVVLAWNFFAPQSLFFPSKMIFPSESYLPSHGSASNWHKVDIRLP